MKAVLGNGLAEQLLLLCNTVVSRFKQILVGLTIGLD